jgi:hypothetical protein
MASTAPEGFMVYPNPAREKAMISLLSEINTTANLKLTDITGRVLINNTVDISEGSNSIPLELYGIKPGAYLVQVEFNGTQVMSKLTIQ